MISTLRFYQVPFTEEENKLIEDINSFLQRNDGDAVEDEHAIFVREISPFQFLKHDLELEIKVIGSELLTPLFDANYVEVRNIETRATGKSYYYFIKSITPVSENALKLTLRMDTLNNYGGVIVDAQNWLPSTLVEREHADRYWPDEDGSFAHTALSNSYAKKVDAIPEGIQFPLIKTNKQFLTDTLSSKFYLVYRSSFVYGATEQDQSANAIKCFLVAEKNKHIPIYNYAGNAIDVSLQDDLLSLLPNVGDILVFDSEENPDVWYEKFHILNSVRYYNGTNMKYARDKGLKGFVGIYKATSSTYRIFTILFSGSEAQTTFTEYYAGGAYNGKDHINDPATSSYYGQTHRRSEALSSSSNLIFKKVRVGYKYSLGTNPSSNIPAELQTWGAWLSAKSNWSKQVYAQGIGIQEMMTIDQVDRTDARLIRIIELPYAPNAPIANGSGENLHYTFGSNWSTSEDYDEENMDMVNAFQLVGDIEPDFSHILESKYFIGGVSTIPSNLLTSWSKLRETKLFHSDFTKHLLVYDNFSMELKEEKMFSRYNFWYDSEARPSGVVIPFGIEYTASSNLTSGNLFSLHYTYEDDDIAEYYYDSEETYPLTLVAVRNNELNLYNASYLNYIRSGYNYDVKAKSIQEKSGILGATQGFINGLIGVANSGASGTPAGVAHAFTGLFGAIYNYDVAMKQIGFQMALAQNQIDKTLSQSALQGTNVAGADNLSLFNKYNKNKLLRVDMEILPVYQDKVASLLHYFGYASQKYKVPNFTGRCFFNYVKCQPVLKKVPMLLAIRDTLYYSSTHGTSEKLLEDVLRRFTIGVFIIHKFAPNTLIGNINNTWNVSMDKENWENFILEDREV